MNFLKDIVDFFIPAYCGVCKHKLSRNEKVICNECFYSILPITKPFCEQCGKPTNGEAVCNDCIEHPHNFSRARAIGTYNGITGELVRLFKYKKKTSISKRLGNMLGIILQSDEFLSCADAIIPVPLHRVAYRSRGYNQSELLAYEVSKITQLPVLTNILYRIKPTKPQKSIDEREKRLANVKGAFRSKRSEKIEGKKVILIDDVCTTGATLDECASELNKAGASDIYALVCART